MKAKILLAILPALGFLAGCSGESKPNANEFLETGTACQEVFGDGEAYVEKKGARRLEESDFTTPIIYGVQHKSYTEETTDYLAIRFIAEVVSIDPVLTWTRAATQIDGEEVKVMDNTIVCTKFYEYLLDVDDITPIYPDSGFNFFVVYTMYNIPTSQANTFMMAYLTISDPGEVDPHASVSSLAGVSQIRNGGEKFSVAANINSYFIAGKIAGSAENTVLPLPSGGGNNGKIEDVKLNKNDQFGFFNLTASHFNYFAFSNSAFNIQGGSIATEVANSSFFKLKETSYHSFWINGSDKLYVGVKIYNIGLSDFVSPSSTNVTFIYYWDNDGSTPDRKYIIQNDASTIAIPTSATGFKLVQMPEGTTESTFDWGSQLAATGDCGVYSGSFYGEAINFAYNSGTSKYEWSYKTDITSPVTLYVEYSGTKKVYVTGDFNSWGFDAGKILTQGENNLYSITFNVTPGEQEYKFVFANSESDPTAIDWTASDTEFGSGNRSIS